MVYTLVGEKSLIEEEIIKLLKEYESSDVSRYNMEDISVKKVLEDVNTISFFGKRVVIADNFDKISKSDSLINYLENPGENILILTSLKNLDNKKLSKVLKEKTKVVELFKYDFVSYIKRNLEDFDMSFMDINLLISYCNYDINRIKNELEKLKIYKIDSKKIVSDDIKKIVKKDYNSTIFNLIDSINSKDKINSFKIYKELLEIGETDEKIMYTLANHYRLLFNISRKIKVFSDNDIINEYKMHPFRLTKLKEQLNIISENDILMILKKFSDIDIEVKKGNKSINTELVLFLENL